MSSGASIRRQEQDGHFPEFYGWRKIMSKPVTVALAGIGGYGGFYVNALMQFAKEGKLQFVGGIDPNPERGDSFDLLQTKGVPIYDSLQSFYQNSFAELMIVSTPIHLHCAHACYALEHGSHLLCEKPLSATVEQAKLILGAQKKSGKIGAVGFQWCFSDAVLNLKRDILRGEFGKPRRLKTLVLWPRSKSYFSRNSWAGRIRTDSGEPVFDSVVSNATSHFLNNMFFVLGDSIEKSACPAKVTAELYRAYNIENYDTAALRCQTESGVEILFFASHVAERESGPDFLYEFEHGRVIYSGRNSDIIAEMDDGIIKNYGDPFAQPENKILSTIDAIETGAEIVCDIETAMSHTLCVGALHESAAEIVNFPSSMVAMIETENGVFTVAKGLGETLLKCYDGWTLPSEASPLPWTKPGNEIDLVTI
jgi:predicted dehydrogenase